MAKCVLCNANATITEQENASRTIYHCQNCGVFVISDLVMQQVKKHHCELAAFFTTRKMIGYGEIVLVSYDKAKRDKDYLQLTVDQILDHTPKSFTALMDKVLQNLALLSPYEGKEIRVEGLESFPLFWVKQASYDAMSFVIKSMQKFELLEVNYYGNSFFPCGVMIAPKGWDRLAQLQQEKTQDKNAVLLYSSVSDGHAEMIRAAAKKAVKECGYTLLDAKVTELGNPVNHELMCLVKHSALLLCDLSHPSGSMYYAMGMAQALNKTQVLTCHASATGQLGVDPSQLCVLSWDEEKDLYLQILNAIRALS